MAQTQNIKEHMDVIASDGQHVGTVDHMEGADRIKLAKNDPKANGKHHFIPVGWVDHVDSHVHLNKASTDVMKEWQVAA